jgi:hypothetical protein
VAFYSGEDRMTRQEIRKSIIGCAAELKHVPSLEELLKMTPVSHRQIIKHFGGYIAALRDTGLELKSVIGRGHGVPLEKLFTDWAGVVQKLKKLPSINEYTLLSQYSPYPLMRRFGKWLQVPHGLKQFAEKCGLAEKWKAELELVPAPPAASANGLAKPRLLLPDRRVYGAPMFPGPMAYAPVNEMGVVFLFGWMAPQLGYVVHWLQSEFPDCELMRRVGEDKSQPLKAELEYESRNFLKHMHDVKGCDMIICWRHNWPACPLEVLELRSLLPKLLDYQTTSLVPSAEKSCNPKS